MRWTVRSSLVAVLAALGVAACAAPASAGIWTEIPSGTSSTITAIEYQSATRFWFTTSSGEIWKRRADLSGFTRVRPASAIPLNDIEFQTVGDVGLAVGNGGVVLRSRDAGANWTPVAGIIASNLGDGSGNKCTIATPLGDANFVRFAGDGRAWIGAGDRQIVTSQPPSILDAGRAGTWIDANRKPVPVPRDNCWIAQSGGFADMFVTSNPDVFYIGAGGGDAIFSVANLRNVAQTKPAGVANGFSLAGKMAGDTANPERMWAVSPTPYGNSTAQYTEDGYLTAHWFRLANEDTHPWPVSGPYDIDFAGGTVLAAGDAGFLIHSTNGRDFYWNGGDGVLAGQDWRAVGLATATDGAVGGTNGKLAISTQANVTPDLIDPRGTISGPSSATAGEAVSFTLDANDEGGSGLNPGSYAWSVVGLPGQSGSPVAFTFPRAGFYTVTVSFADNAGNAGTATKSVTVSGAAVVPPPGRGAGTGVRTPARRTPGGGSAGRGAAAGPVAVPRATATIVGRRVRVRVNGAVRVPRGRRLRAVCRGQVGIALSKQAGRRQARLASARARLAPSRGACRYTKVLFVPRSRVGEVRRLRLTVRFPGNRVLRAGRRTTQLVVTK